MKQLRPGLELDAVIAEKVMGIPKVTEFYDASIYGTPAKHLPPKYSSEAGAAWEVILMLESKGFDMRLEIKSKQVIIYPDKENHMSKNSLTISGETIQHAICLAALQALKIST